MSVECSKFDLQSSWQKTPAAPLSDTRMPVPESESFVPPINVPVTEFKSNDEPRSRHLQSSAKLPDCETGEQIISPRTHVLLMSYRKSESDSETAFAGQHSSNLFSFQCHSGVNTMEAYTEKVEQFMSSAKSQAPKEVWILHEIEVLSRGTSGHEQLVIGDKVVQEPELLEPFCLHCRQEPKPMKLRMFHLMVESASSTCHLVSKSKKATFLCEDCPPNCATLCGSEFRSFLIGGCVNWGELRQAFDRLERSGTEVKADDLAGQIELSCSRLHSRRMSGIPSAELPPAVPVALDDVDASYSPPEIPEVATVQSPVKSDPLSQLQQLQRQPSNECAEAESQQTQTNVFIEVTIGKYKNDKDNRKGCNKDHDNFKQLAKCLRCNHEDVHSLYSADREVNAEEIRNFIRSIVNKYKSKCISCRCIFLALSAHGSEAGIRTSDEKVITLSEIMLPLEELGGFVLLLYQACRGSRHHPAMAGDKYQPLACGLVTHSPDTAGCVLPPELVNAAAIFASMAGYEAYRNEQDGSWMPRALLEVARRRGSFSISQLAEMLQTQIHEFKPDGIFRRRHGTAYMQIQFSANGGGENFVIETGPPGGAEAAAPGAFNEELQEAPSSAAAVEELTPMPVSRPSQAD